MTIIFILTFGKVTLKFYKLYKLQATMKSFEIYVYLAILNFTPTMKLAEYNTDHTHQTLNQFYSSYK